MKCDINTSVSISLSLDLTAFATIQRALAFYVERAPLQAGDPAKDLQWKFAAMLTNLRKTGGRSEEPKTAIAGPTAPALGEMVNLGSVEAPEEGADFDVESALSEEYSETVDPPIEEIEGENGIGHSGSAEPASAG